MNNISRCLKFQIKRMLISTLVFILLYYLASFAMTSIIIISAKQKSSSFNSGFFIGAAFFAFIYVIADYRSSFNYLMIYGNTRRTTFLSTSIINVILSVILAVFSVVSNLLDGTIANLIGFGRESGINLLQLMYPNSNKASEMLFLIALTIMITSFSMLYGALNYKFGKIFLIVFWVCFGMIFVTFPVAINGSAATGFIKVIEAFLCIGNPSGILLAPINFILAALIFSAVGYLISSRQPQTAPVQ